ncbi:MAG: hypothetical protein B6D72_05350 [gamma proteobacterium symbiont of Ctena orbiculata]|nr:hypothetical protein [Candidatus Thiodiazotropha taylori]PVV13683.1 MAG: hypothetical protein B6D72_05350 [gamma proteobacterium symbiont of Ctena orbiculata]MBT2997263.1 hypothetical protein [Candidatus Thiodiazotropha taylori]MBT3001027.1 hypothetical protein [Candidatus Thiodiazotropha taylori]MBT3027845.1 hypothetical protein [Candidatus Thiodiazotropha taylori]
MAELALFIDAVGLEMFLMLLEVQIVVMFSLFFNKTIKSAYIYVKNLFLKLLPILSWESIKENPGNLILVVPSPAILMHVMVVSTLLDIAFFTK